MSLKPGLGRIRPAEVKLITLLLLGGVTSAHADQDALTTLEQINLLVQERFYSAEVLTNTHWQERVQKARQLLSKSSPLPLQNKVFSALLQSLDTSHTEYLPRHDPRYWELASIYEDILTLPAHCTDSNNLPPLPILHENIGVLWKQLGTQWFIAGVLDDGPAKVAGLRLGDEVVSAEGRPFEPVLSFENHTNKKIRLGVRSAKGQPPRIISVIPRKTKPQEAFRTGLKASARIIQEGATKIAYLRIWSWAGAAIQQELRVAINRLNDSKPSAFIVDIRDGWGGAWPHDVAIFNPNVPVLESTRRSGQVVRTDTQIRVPAALLVNKGSRSGKETVAYSVKKHHLATIVGEQTAGALLPGTVFCLENGALLYIATANMTIDGEVIEKRGIKPDIIVPFDVRYAQGHDPQLNAALRVLRQQVETP